MSQFAEKPQEMFENLNKNNVRLQELLNLENTTIQTLQKGDSKLRKCSEETNKRLKQVLEEQYHSERYRDYLGQYIKRLFNLCKNIKPQSKGHVFGNNTNLQEDIKADALMESKYGSP
ncbi:hypothetical protein O181_023469 [Austropuccinia psidii MF-1]|uniref:Uncharacterized protein n=1 Tax=Austropuccinia psidii MF-1 TaxID=1389203 RepID=A0A9Q3CGR6_9BASI|nr:hypothetical protein [Austropuccinia psidii MF-1]